MAYVPGMPSNIPSDVKKKAEESYKKQQEQKKSSSSSSSTTIIPGAPSNVQQQINQQNQNNNNSQGFSQTFVEQHKTEISSAVQKVQTIIRNNDFANVAVQQAQANQSFIDYISNNKSVGSDASKLVRETNTASKLIPAKLAARNDETFQQFLNRQTIQEFSAEKAYEKLPTSERQKIKNMLQFMNSADRTSSKHLSRMNEIYKLIQSNEAEYKQRKLNEMYDSRFWEAGEHQFVTYATAADYYNMQKIGFETVLIEDGDGTLENKGGVYTIGRNKLSGVPRDIKTVLVDTDGNWRYIADTGKRANFVEEMQNRQYALTVDAEKKFSRLSTAQNFTQHKLDELEKKAAKLEEKAARTRKQSDWDAYQLVTEELIKYKEYNKAANEKIRNIAVSWATQQDIYTRAIDSKVKFTAEDEARYQTLKLALERNNVSGVNKDVRNKIHDSSVANMLASDTKMLSEFMELSKRREESKYSAVFINKDARAYMDDEAAAMQKAVDDYNLWDWATVHAEKGEMLGDQMKRLFLRDMLGWGDTDTVTDLGDPTSDWMPTKRDIREADSSDFLEDLGAIGETIAKTVWRPWVAARTANQRAEDAYWEAEEKKKEINRLRDTGRISNKEAIDQLNELSKNQFSYLAIQKDAFSQAGTLMFSNVMNDLSVFDILSIQSAVVAYKMAAHPERYANDPKFKKMQDAFKAIYGTNYRGDMDAGKMAMAMISIKARESGTGKRLGNDFIYLDGSDLRHGEGSLWEGEKYGFWASLGVGIGTDIGALISLGKVGVEAVAKTGGTRILAKSATDSFIQSLTRADVSKEVAEQAAKSLKVQAAIRKDIYGSIKKSLRGQEDNLAKTVGKQLNERASMFQNLFVDDLVKGLDDVRYSKFLDDLATTLNRTTDLAERSLLINKGTVIAKTLGTVDDMLDTAQRKLFTFTCPAAGVVTAISKGNKLIRDLKNLKLADEDTLAKLFISGEQAKAIIAKMDFNSCLDGTMFRKLQEDLLDQFNWQAMSDLKHKLTYGKAYAEAMGRFSDYKDMIMRGVADSYVSSVMNKLSRTMEGAHGLDELEKLAAERGFKSFDEMHTAIKENLASMYQFSSESKGIVDAFSNAYDTKVIQKKLGNIKDYVENAQHHVDCITTALNSKGASILSELNAKTQPEFVIGTAKMLSNSIHDFLYTMNNDLISYVDKLGNPVSLHEIGVHAMAVLDDVAYGALDGESLARARDAVQEYVDELSSTYMKNLADWKANAFQDALGQQNYLSEITKVVPEYAGSRQVLDSVHAGFVEYFEKKGIKVTEEDINEILVTNKNELGKKLAELPEEQRNATIYRIMENKGTQIIGQISDSNMKMLTDALTDCNSQLNKNLRLLQDQLEDAAVKQRVTDAIANACGIANTRKISDAMKLGGVDSTMYMGVIDVLAGHSNEINRIIQTESVDVAVSKCKDYIMREVSNQLALHNGTYKTFRKMVGETVDVGTNVRYIENWLDGYIPADENCIDICVSMLKPTDGASPKDIAFHVRGASGNPTVFRKSGNFAVFDNGFSSRAYGKNAQQLTEEYARLGITDGLTPDEWRHQLAAYINTQKELALKENKTIRFIGFNSSDALTGNNKWLTDTLRSCGVNANMANAMDLADVMRSKFGEYIFDPAQIEALSKGLRESITSAKANSVALGVSPTVAYDPKYNCADIIKGSLGKHQFADEVTSGHAKYIVDSLDAIDSNLGTKAYNEVGDVMGAYIDATALARKLEDYGITQGTHIGGDIMKILSEATAKGEPQLGINKIIDTALDEKWVDLSKMDGTGLKFFGDTERVHESVLQLNSMFDNMHRTDLITEADRNSLLYIYKEIATMMPKTEHSAFMIRILKAEEMSAQQLYVVNKWLLDNLHNVNPNRFDKLYGRIIINAPRQASYLSDVGYTFVRSNVIDYTDETLDAFFVKYLDDSEESFRFAQDLERIRNVRRDEQNLKNYMDAVEGLFTKYNIHGTQDRMIFMQMAEVHRPIAKYRDAMKQAYQSAYNTAVKELAKEAKQFGKKAKYSKEMIEKVATERGVRAARQYIAETSEAFRYSSVQAVANLNANAFKAHLVRNCCGGMVIDPTAKCVQGLDLPLLFEKWKDAGIRIDEVDFSNDIIKNRKLFRISLPELDTMSADDIFAKYDAAHIDFVNPAAASYKNMRHGSFGASDGTLMNVEHQQAFRELFFGDGTGTLCDLNENFRSWRNELYSCNMWTDMDLKQLVNPYYTDNLLNNMAQNTHQLRNNIDAVHDMATVMNNRYMNTEHILRQSGVLDGKLPIAEQRQKIIDQLAEQKQRLCVITFDENHKFKLIDYTPRLTKSKTDDKFFEAILKNTVMVDESMYSELASWSKATNVALKMQASNAPEWLTNAYNIYKKTLRSAAITMYLYGNLGTAVRNYVDSSTKGFAETLQYDESVITYMKKYLNAVKDVHDYSNTYRCIEDTLGRVNHETVAKYFAGNEEALNKFNILYGYEHTCGESLVTDLSRRQAQETARKPFVDAGIDSRRADQIRKNIDAVYGSRKYYGMTNAQLEKHSKEIHDACMKRLREQLNLDENTMKIVSEKFWDYSPTVETWGDKMCKFPVLGFNRGRFNNAEVRARLAVYQTFLEGGASEYEAMQHVTATQFHYAGIGKVEDIMPFTQYKLYNALYWFENANMHTVSTAWRAAQYNGDGSLTSQEISAMIAKFRTAQYKLFDKGQDAAYDAYYDRQLSVAEHILTDGVDSYLGVPRNFNTGNLDLNGTHYLKLGNSFVEELDMVLTCAAGIYRFGSTIGRVSKAEGMEDKLRLAYESLKYTPLYDSVYSPWKSWFDFVAFSYDYKKMNNAKDNRNPIERFRDNYKEFLAYKGTHDEAIAMLPLVGAVIDNVVKRKKSFELNKGELMAVLADPYAQHSLFSFIGDAALDTAGMLIPSVIGTKIDPYSDMYPYTYAPTMLRDMLVENPATYFDMMGRLQKEFGFTEDQAQDIWKSMTAEWKSMTAEWYPNSPGYNGMPSNIAQLYDAEHLQNYRSKLDYYKIAAELYSKGYNTTEITNLFKQHGLPDMDNKRFLMMTQSLPGYLRYDKDMRSEIIAYYKSMGMSADQAWAKLLLHPAIIRNGKIVEITHGEATRLSKMQQKAYYAMTDADLTDEEWKAYWKNMPYRYPKGKWSETYQYLRSAGYSKGEARKLLLDGFMLDNNGKLVDVQGKARARAFSYNALKGAEWDAYWNTVPDYTKYEKGAFGRTMKALKKMGYDDATARALIQQGIYVDKNGNMMNVTGMQRPVLGYPSFNAYYQTIPDYCKYEKGAFKRTYAALKGLGFDYDTSLRLIQQGAYLMDASFIPSVTQTLGARRQKDGSDIPVTNLTTLLLRYGGQIIKGADGKDYMLIDCSGLQRPRKSFGYSRRGYGGGGGRGLQNYSKKNYSKKKWNNYPKYNKNPYGQKYGQYFMRKPFVMQGNVSTFNGFTNFRGSNKLAKPYTTGNAVSTYSLQNFLNGASYGMRKTYKVDMRQYKTGAMSTKSAYPASYRNIAVAYRHNLYKDMYAKYGASRIMMRANQPGYSNASIVRLRRNEIANRERYAERRDLVSKINSGRIKKASR